MRPKFFIFNLCILASSIIAYSTVFGTNKNTQPNNDSHLLKPTGKYEVGFNDFHWINNHICPDVNFNGKNVQDFSSTNKEHCREIIVRVYYPSTAMNQSRSSYYPPFIKWQQKDILKKMPDISKNLLEKMNQIKSYSHEKIPVVNRKQFPVLLFNPGFGFPAQAYENFIVELASHGYIVIGINSPFINRVALPNGHVVEEAQAKSFDEFENSLVPLQIKDLLFVLDQAKFLSKSNSIFSSIDFKRVGAFGHSIGGRIIADATHTHPEKFQAAATLDIGIDESGKSLKPFSIPFMYIISANRKLASQTLVTFELGNNGYLVCITPNEKNHDYSRHDNFSDLSTLQNLPALQTLTTHNKQRFAKGFNLKFFANKPSKHECDNFTKISYVLIKKENKWSFSIYEDRKKTNDIDITMIDGLPEALTTLPNKSPSQLSGSDIKPIEQVMVSLHHILGASYLGTGDGFEITKSINTNLVGFFDTYLKKEQNSELKKCLPLSQDSYVKCGPGQG